MTIFVSHNYMSNQTYAKNEMVPIEMPDFISRLFAFIQNNASPQNFLRRIVQVLPGEKEYETDFMIPVTNPGLLKLMGDFFTQTSSPRKPDEDLPENLKRAITYYRYTTREELASRIKDSAQTVTEIVKGLTKEGYIEKLPNGRFHFPAVTDEWVDIFDVDEGGAASPSPSRPGLATPSGTLQLESFELNPAAPYVPTDESDLDTSLANMSLTSEPDLSTPEFRREYPMETSTPEFRRRSFRGRNEMPIGSADKMKLTVDFRDAAI